MLLGRLRIFQETVEKGEDGKIKSLSIHSTKMISCCCDKISKLKLKYSIGGVNVVFF